jgi:hypothetical protein
MLNERKAFKNPLNDDIKFNDSLSSINEPSGLSVRREREKGVISA